MIRGALTVSTFIATILLPWPATALLALAVASVEPLVPFGAGLFTDVLYYSSDAARLPYATLLGALASALALFVHRRLAEGIID